MVHIRLIRRFFRASQEAGFFLATAGPTRTYLLVHETGVQMPQLRNHGALDLGKSGMDNNESDPGLEPVNLWQCFAACNVVAVKPLAQVVDPTLSGKKVVIPRYRAVVLPGRSQYDLSWQWVYSVQLARDRGLRATHLNHHARGSQVRCCTQVTAAIWSEHREDPLPSCEGSMVEGEGGQSYRKKRCGHSSSTLESVAAVACL
ncbi:hypothetical protein BJX66DRAFT_301356, partial [Aspergillus keveii]